MNEAHTTALIIALCTIIVLLLYLCELVAQMRVSIIVADRAVQKTRTSDTIHDPIM